MQPYNDPPRDTLTSDDVVALIQDAPAISIAGGLEIVSIDLEVIEDISGDLAGGSVGRQSYANLHGTTQLSITRTIDWGGDLLRPYLTISDGITSARFNMGVYHPTTPSHNLQEDPPTYDVEGYDIMLRLAQSVGDAFSIAAGEFYLTKIEEILLARGYTQYVIDQTAASEVAPTARVWAFDDQITWLTIVNDMLGSIGYAGIWSDWNGRLRLHPYQNPIERAPEWHYSDDALTTMLSTKRSVDRDYFNSPNRWVIYRSNQVDEATPVEGNGMYSFINENVGDTSVAARRGLIITHVEGVDVANQGALIARANQIINADMEIPTLYVVEVAPNPLHWHFDRMLVQDSAALPVADVMCTQWSMPLPPDHGDMVQSWRVLSQ